MDKLAYLLATGGFGRHVPAPGTVGSLCALALGIGLAHIGGLLLIVLSLIVVTPAAYWACYRYLVQANDHDPKEVIIDEVLGQWIAMLPAVSSYPALGAAFVLFRLFDILKPGPVGWADQNLHGNRCLSAFGILADDLIAGVLAALLILLGKALMA